MKKHHPEQETCEIYMGNTTLEAMRKSSWLTRRMGTIAYRSNGTAIDDPNFRPWFIQCSEVEQAIRTEELSDKPWAAERIKALRPMLEQQTCFVAETPGRGQP